MPISSNFLPEFDQEISSARRVLERVPDDKLEWRAHPKSPTFQWLAFHVANLPSWIPMMLAKDSLDIEPTDGSEAPRSDMPSSRQGMLDSLEQNSAEARAALNGATDEQMLQPWTLLKGGQALFTMPRVAVYRWMIMNHLIHHRAELCVYLRLNDIPVPGLYGPSADEQTT